ncbi:MAG: hypothetical protein J5449_00040, partial [Oscillospiraceae bacterium]|nr:hypothetical protein [Oscillospiraceae bacterium]
GKQGDGLTAVGDYDGSDWKLTLLDESRKFYTGVFAAEAMAGETLPISYIGATWGENEYISAILTDETGAALYYGRLAQPTAADGTVTVTIPADLAAGEYTLKLFSEQYNGDKKTDYASAFSNVTLTVKPAAPIKTINLVSGKADYIKGAQQTNVWFGNYMQSSADSKEPVKWRVLQNKDGKLFLLSDQNLDVVRYNEEFTPVTWADCTLRAWLNGYPGNPYNDSFIGSAFSEKELTAVADSAVENANNPSYNTPGGDDTTDKVFLLSIAEAKNTDYGFTDNYDTTDTRVSTNMQYVANGGHTGGGMNGVGGADYWWLRSPGGNGLGAAIVNGGGTLNHSGINVDDYLVAVRPALNVDLGKVLFTSPAENGKQGDGLTAVGNYTGSDWKLTVKDECRSGFRARCTAIENGVYTIAYSGASTGDNEKISAVIVDADGVVTYYGVLENAKAGENTLTLDVSGKLDDGDKLYIFNEQANGDKKTDYASELVDVTERSILSYDLWVGGIEVTEDCTSGEGWEYAPATNTLTLNDYQYEGEGHALPVGNWVYSADTSRAAIVYAGIEPLNLVIEGDNAVKQTGGDLQTSVGLFSEGALTISGTGTLTAEAGAATLEVSSNTNYTFGILCWGALTVTGGTVTGRGGTGKSLHRTWGIYAKGFELSFGEVYAYGGTVTDTGFNCGLQSVGTVTVSGGKLTCRGEKTPKGSIGLWTGGNMTVTGGTVDVASGEGSSSGYGIAGGRRGDVLYIGASVESFVSVGTGYAVDDFLTVKNEIPGKGWKTVDGTGNVTEIAANPAPGAGLYMYKKVEFEQFKKYDLWVGDTEVTEECTSGEGWEYAPATNTLTLNNYQYEGAGHSFDDTWNNSGGTYSATAAICYLGSEPLHLVIEDENTVKQTGAGDSSFGILCVTDLDISGTGELNVTAGTATNFSYGIQCVQTLSITGGTIHAFGGSAVYTAGLSAHRFSMDNGEVYAVGGEAGSFSFGIFYAPAGKPDAFCNVAGGKLTCRGGNASSLSCALGFNDSATFSGGEIDLAG